MEEVLPTYEEAVNFLYLLEEEFNKTRSGKQRKSPKPYMTKENFRNARIAVEKIISTSVPDNDKEKKLNALRKFDRFLTNIINNVYGGYRSEKTGKLLQAGKDINLYIKNIKGKIDTYLKSLQSTNQPLVYTPPQLPPVKRTFATMADLPRENLPTSIPVKFTLPPVTRPIPQQIPEYLSVMKGISNKIDTSNRYLKDIDTELLNYVNYRKNKIVQPLQQVQVHQHREIQRPDERFPRYYTGVPF